MVNEVISFDVSIYLIKVAMNKARFKVKLDYIVGRQYDAKDSPFVQESSLLKE